MLSFILECGISTGREQTRAAHCGSGSTCQKSGLSYTFRSRPRSRPSFSITSTRRTTRTNKSLPARLRHTGDQSIQRGFAERQPRAAKLAPITAAAAAERAAIRPHRVGLASRGNCARPAPMRVSLSIQRGARRILLHRLLLALIALFSCFLRHKSYFVRRRRPRLLVLDYEEEDEDEILLRRSRGFHRGLRASFASASGKPISFNKSSASASVRALVTIVTSMPCVPLDLVQLDLRENRLIRDAEGIVAAAVKFAG